MTYFQEQKLIAFGAIIGVAFTFVVIQALRIQSMILLLVVPRTTSTLYDVNSYNVDVIWTLYEVFSYNVDERCTKHASFNGNYLAQRSFRTTLMHPASYNVDNVVRGTTVYVMIVSPNGMSSNLQDCKKSYDRT